VMTELRLFISWAGELRKGVGSKPAAEGRSCNAVERFLVSL
jgi:hypothetical protein